jgi:phospholipid transport system substrate-binding protein
MTFLRLRSSPALLACVCAVTLPVVSTRAADDPAPALVATINGVIDLVLGKSPAAIQEQLPAIRTRMSDMFANEVIVQRAFGPHWKQLTPAQQTEAVDLVSRLIIRTYALQVSTGVRPEVKVSASREIGPDRREVVSTFVRKSEVVNVVYRLGKIDAKWKVYDVLAEGVSVVGNYRQQFDAHFQKGSVAELLTLLKNKLAEIPPAKKEGS